MENKTCCRGVAGECVRNQDDRCTFTKKCLQQTPESEFECDCVCSCECTKTSCTNCTCDCRCTPEMAQKLETSEGIKYRCEYTCSC